MMALWTALLSLFAGPQETRPPPPPSSAPPETVIIECPGLKCASCQLGVLRSPKAFPGIRSVQFDPASARLFIEVEPGFDRHTELLLKVQRVADPIEMFRATLLKPRQVFLYLDASMTREQGDALVRALREIEGVRSVYRDDRSVLSVVMDDGTDRSRILKCARDFGLRGELFETRFAQNVESRISEESHHVIGVLLVILCFLLVGEKLEARGLSWIRIVIPGIWIVAGLLVFVLGDLDAWPYRRTLWDSLHDKMILQHKVLSVGMMLLGVAEHRRRIQRGWKYSAVTLFLAVAGLSGVLLQYHVPNMVDPAHLEAWTVVNRQHLLAAIVGGLALTARALHEYDIVRKPGFRFAWPLLLGLEGVLLCVFVEPVW